MFQQLRVAVLMATLSFVSFCAPLRIAIAGLTHGHVSGFLRGGALAPAGGILHRSDVQLVGIAEKNRALFDKYSATDGIASNIYFASIEKLLDTAHPDAVLICTDTLSHTAVVEACARHHVHVMMEKPLAVSHHDALAMRKAAAAGGIHVLVDYETTWYPNLNASEKLLSGGSLGPIRKVVVHDGHPGPKAIGVSPEFFGWLTDPKLNGAGALFDFGCYGADIMTWFLHGATPMSVTAVTQQLQPETYPKVEDEANVIVKYPNAVAILQASWNWPIDRKDLEIYGTTGQVRTVLRDGLEIRHRGENESQTEKLDPLSPPYDDPLHYLAALIHGEIKENGDLSSLETNIIVTEILEAARRSAASGRSVSLPLHE